MNLTRFIIIGFVVIILAVDAWLALKYGIDATISVQITKWSHEYPAIPFAFGILMGHFFFTYGIGKGLHRNERYHHRK